MAAMVDERPRDIACGVCRLSINPQREMCRAVGSVSLHDQCFRCVTCLEPFADGTFYPVNGKAYCEEDYMALFSARCAECMEMITGKSITAGDRKYHLDCFNCPGCSVSLVGQKYITHKGVPMCKSCHRDRLNVEDIKQRDKCNKCSRAIKSDDFLMFKGKKYCPHHFNCKMCRLVLTKSAREHEGTLYCQLCYEKVKVKYCFACKMPILGRVVSALGKSWHPEHFVCCVCESSFSHDAFFEHKGQAYCETHYHRLFGRVCYKTNGVMKEGEVDALGNVWGTENFQCFGCGSNLSAKMRFTGYEGRPFCADCNRDLDKNVKSSIRRCQDGRALTVKNAKKRTKDDAKPK